MDDTEKRLQALEKAISDLQTERVGKQDIIPTSIKPSHLANNGKPNTGDTFYADQNANFSTLPIGSSGSLMEVAAGLPAWLAPGQNGNLLWVNGGIPAWLANGTASQVLQISGGIPSWQTFSGGTPADNASVQITSNQSVAANSTVNLTFDTKNWDSDTMVDLVTHSDRITATHAGVYIVTINTIFAASSVGTRQIGIVAGGTSYALHYMLPISTAQPMAASFTVNLTAAQYVQSWIFQDSGGNLNVTGAYLQVSRVG